MSYLNCNIAMAVCARFFLVCGCLASLGWTTPVPEGENSLFPENVNPETITEGATEGDILVTKEQEIETFLRKATPYSSRLWPAGSDGIVTVPYVIGDDIDRSKLLEAIDQWRDNTCLEFEEVSEDFSGPHLQFRDSTGCSSYIGLVKSSGQEVNLHRTCVSSVGPAVHEIGHALGFYHEQSRSDRDNYVDILLVNVLSGSEGNFDKHSTKNYDIPYDYYSIMHYGSEFFSSNGENTIVAKRLIAQTLIGNRDRLSVMDIKLANIAYKCIDAWLSKCGLEEEVCQNEGFTSEDCSCVCPPGTSGRWCEQLTDTYTDALIKSFSPHSEEIQSPGTVSTPGYPVPVQEFTKFMKVLRAPACHRVKLTMNDFEMYPRSSSGSCSIDYFTVYLNSNMNNETTFCGKEIKPGTTFVSDDVIALSYKNYNYASQSFTSRFTGFEGTVSHELLPGCESEGESAPAAQSVTTLSSTPVFSVEVNSGQCSFAPTNSVNRFLLRSPGYPETYRNRQRCAFTLTSSAPRFLMVTPTGEALGSRDSFTVTAPGGAQYRITTDTTAVVSANAQVSFRAGRRSNNEAFVIEIEAVLSECHQIIELSEGGRGSFALPTTYSAPTFCEWWIKAPAGKKIQLEMRESFSVGSKTNDFCANDKLLIDDSGDSRYTSATEFCGQNAVVTVVSSGAQMNVLFSGQRGGSASGEAFYSVV